ncbi:MAG TPA: DcaP family trimeric outer membrane transporter [Caulobacteraceae bacterium]|jgi:hypothetical protein
MAITQRGARSRPALSAIGAAAFLGLTTPAQTWAQAAGSAATASPETLDQMRAELQALRAEEAAAQAAEHARSQRIEALARQLGMAPSESSPTAAATVATTSAPPIETITPTPEAQTPIQTKGQAPRNFEIYGFAQADYIQDFKRVDPNWDATLRPSKIPTTPGEFGSNGQSIISVRQSRFGVQASQEVAGEPFYVKFEFDLFGTGANEGQTTFRLRHAYGSWGPILAGQTNSVFMDADNFPNVIDYWGPNGMIFVRTPQIRYTWKSGPHEIAVALEHVLNNIDPGNIREFDPELPVTNDEKVPDLTAHYRYDGAFGHVQLAGVLRRVGYDTPAPFNDEPKGHNTGWGVNLSSNVKTWQKDVLHVSAVYGHGIASYMNDGGVDLAPQTLVQPPAHSFAGPTFTTEAVPIWGVMAYYDHYWTKVLSSSFGYSEVRVVNTPVQDPSAFKVGQYASANLLWSPDPRILIGGEFLWGRLVDKSGTTCPTCGLPSMGDDTRFQLTFKYSFSSNDFR